MNDRIARKTQEYTRLFPSVTGLQVETSNRAGKRLVATFTLGGKRHTVHFGDASAYTWADGAPKSKRDSYRARASRITNGAGQYTYRIAGTANSFAYHILW